MLTLLLLFFFILVLDILGVICIIGIVMSEIKDFIMMRLFRARYRITKPHWTSLYFWRLETARKKADSIAEFTGMKEVVRDRNWGNVYTASGWMFDSKVHPDAANFNPYQ